MNYEGNIFRPPAEHNSILLQVTIGCSHNQCRFCGLYKDKKFSIKNFDQIQADIAEAALIFPNHKRLFLCDGDALIIPHQKLIGILTEINRQMPWLTRIGTYANIKSIAKKSIDELKELKALKLGILYQGIESGDNEILKEMHKGSDIEAQIEQGRKVKSAGLKLSCTVLLGLGGRERSHSHAVKTGEALSKIDPTYANALSLMMFPQIPLYSEVQSGQFPLLSPKELLTELKIMIENTQLTGGIFSANHASNYLPLQFRLPGGKTEALQLIEKALNDEIDLKPEWLRAI